MEITYRFAVPSDAAQLLDYLKTVGGESDNLTFGAEGLPISLEQETKYLESLQNDPCNQMFLALAGEKIVGNSSLNGSKRPRLAHRRELGITVLRDYWGRGVGSGLMERMINYAEETGAELITLAVRSDNLRAKALYRKYSFVPCGTWPGYFRIDGKYFDVDLMALRLTKAE